MIALEHFSIGYGQRRLIDKVDAVFPSSTVTALIGRNGTGKTTLMRAIGGLNGDYAGRILVNGTDISAITTARRARLLALVTTERIRVPDMLCREAVALGRAPYTGWSGSLSANDRRAVERALEDVDMTEYADRPLDRLSDGERQRIMIARALAQDTPAVLLDEPTSFLDLPARYALVAMLCRLAEGGRTIIFSTHELDIALHRTPSVALLADKTLHILPSADMAASGLLPKAFGPLQ